MFTTTAVPVLVLASPSSFSTRELAVGTFLGLTLLYLVYDAVRSGPRRDRKGRFRSKRRTQFVGLLRIGVVVGALWLAASLAGVV